MSNTIAITIGRDIPLTLTSEGTKLVLSSEKWLEFKSFTRQVLSVYEDASQNQLSYLSAFHDENTWNGEHEDSFHINAVFENPINHPDQEMIKGTLSSLKKTFHQEKISVTFGETELV